jgi:formylglycine-generating enzyme required for sulfatase activity
VTARKPSVPAQAVADALDHIIREAERDQRPSFATLVKAAGLDPAQDFIGESLRGIDLRDEDLSGFDFSGADLTAADFRRANLAGVRFDGAIRTGAIGLPQPGDGSVPGAAAFKDAPFAPELVAVPAGEFWMGSTGQEDGRSDNERPQHRVTIRQRFAIGRYAVTFVEYDRFCEARQRIKPDDEGWERERRPVINVSWRDAQAYVAWLSQQTGRPYRLPTEAEWEYACRAGTTSRYSFGDAITPKDANYNESGYSKTSETGTYPPNNWGLYDMHGNVWEWVQDDWHANYQGAPEDGSVWGGKEVDTRSRRCVLRGGSWNLSRRNCRSASRLSHDADGRYFNIGFRVARTFS